MSSKKNKSLLQELNSISESYEKIHLIENTGLNLIAGVSNLIELIEETYDEETAGDLRKRLFNSLKSGDEKKFLRGTNKAKDYRSGDNNDYNEEKD